MWGEEGCSVNIWFCESKERKERQLRSKNPGLDAVRRVSNGVFLIADQSLILALLCFCMLFGGLKFVQSNGIVETVPVLLLEQGST